MARQRKEPPEEESPGATGEESDGDEQELEDDDFQFVLTELLAAYEPVLAEELERARAPERLKQEAREHPPSCEDEFELAGRIFDRFFTEEVAQRLLPKESRQQLGSIEEWRWCLRHIRCCIIFGWLVCRGPRTFRAYNYYLYHYWRCVRQALDVPVGESLTPEEHADFTTLVEALATAYRPYLTDQLATVEFPLGIPDEVIDGRIDCLEGQEESAAIFERLLTTDVAAALLGRKAFEEHRHHPSFWFCRCWCLCAIRFGCCLARARSLRDVLRCLIYYRRCLRRCFRPLECAITYPAPNDCAEEQVLLGPGTIGIEIVGTATGAFCDHYTLEWKAAGAPDTAYSSTGIIYDPPGLTEGACGKVMATLGYLSTGVVAVDNDVTVRLRVIGAPPASAEEPCIVTFQIFRRRVWISGIEGVAVAPPGVLDTTAELKTGTTVRSFGSALDIMGHAWVGKCAGKEIKRYTLSYQPGFVGDPTLGPWTEFWQVDYLSALQKKAVETGHFDLTSSWIHAETCVPNPFPPPDCILSIPYDELWPTGWQSGRNYPDVPVGLQSFPVDPEVPATVWTAQQLPLVNCQSGRYTLRLDVEDTTSVHHYDLQHVWFDNKKIHGAITQVAGVPACSTVNLSTFAAPGADCNVAWPGDLLGIAYDEYIEEGNTAIPSDNYAMIAGVVQGGYALWIKKDGAPNPGVPLPVPGPGAPPWGAPFQGTTRVGDPGERCSTADPPPGPLPPPSPGILASLDFRRLDAECNPAEPGLTLERGECCGYNIRLEVWDNSVCPSFSGGHHVIAHDFPICICNDLPPVKPPIL
jgi:hypothetical protein